MTNAPDAMAALNTILSEHGLSADYSMQAQWLPMNTAAVTTTYAVQGKDKVVLADGTGGAFTVTLPDARLRKNAQPITIKRTSAAGNITIASAGGTIDGAATVTLAAQYALRTVISNGTNWIVIASI